MSAAELLEELKTQGVSISLDGDEVVLRPGANMPVDGNIEHVPPCELEQIIIATAENISEAPRQALLVKMARNMGFSRTGAG